MKLGVIIPAAGASQRFGGKDKLNADLAGRPLLHRTVEVFVNHECCADIIVAGPADNDSFAEFRLRHGDKLGLLGVSLCQGGKEHRWQTVKAALEHVPDDCTHIAVHDAARVCASHQLLDRLFEAASKHDAVIPAVPVADTLKEVSAKAIIDDDIDPLDAVLGSGSNVTVRQVVKTVSRENLVGVQTPQVFKADLLRKAYEQDDLSSTDDAGLIERLGEPVVVIEGDPMNIKVTRPNDLRLAMAILGLRAPKDRPTHKRF
jgi:2-C-methyl-D-erythritol 4-phosphate cytidylyltransferase